MDAFVVIEKSFTDLIRFHVRSLEEIWNFSGELVFNFLKFHINCFA